MHYIPVDAKSYPLRIIMRYYDTRNVIASDHLKKFFKKYIDAGFQ
jgi:hypothetical protein